MDVADLDESKTINLEEFKFFNNKLELNLDN